MSNDEKNTKKLDHLLESNRERTADYEQAINECPDEDTDLKGIFEILIRRNNFNKRGIEMQLNIVGRSIKKTVLDKGIFHHICVRSFQAWIYIKAIFSEDAREVIVQNWVSNDPIVGTVSLKGLATPLHDLPKDIRAILIQQQEHKAAYDQIRALRDR